MSVASEVTMTQKYLIALAEALYKSRPYGHTKAAKIQWAADVMAVADVAEAHNERFKRGVFLKACGLAFDA